MNRNIIIVIVLVVLVLLTAVQAIQLNSLKNSISAGTVSGGSTPLAPVPSSGGHGGSGVPSNIQNLPSMVGGC